MSNGSTIGIASSSSSSIVENGNRRPSAVGSTSTTMRSQTMDERRPSATGTARGLSQTGTAQQDWGPQSGGGDSYGEFNALIA